MLWESSNYMAVQSMILQTPLGTLLGLACNIIFSFTLIQAQRIHLAFLTPWTSPLNCPMEAINCSPDFPRSGSFLTFISLMGLGYSWSWRLPPSSRLHESGIWQSLYRLEIEMVRVLRGQTERLGGATGRLGRAMGRNLGAVEGLQWCF
jgi:hypothetical protein